MKIKQVFDKAEKIGVIGSPSSTNQLTIDVLATAVEKKLVGALSVFNYRQDGYENYALGQITEIILNNPWTQDPTMRGIIRRRERVDPVTERQDIHTANMFVSSVFAENESIEPSIFGTVPPTGTSIRLLNEEIMGSLLKNYQDELFYLGSAYGTGIKMPMWFKHFGHGKTGAGEAYHIGVFGKTGSGKSILATMIVAGYAKNEEMNIFILDPQGQFSKEFRKEEFSKKISENPSEKILIVNLHNLILSGDSLFKKVLIASNFLKKWWNIKHIDNQSQATEQIIRILNSKRAGQFPLGMNTEPIKPWHYYRRESFDRIRHFLLNNETVQRAIYTSQDTREGMINAVNNADPDEVYDEWKNICGLFSYENNNSALKIKDIIQNIVEGTGRGKIIIIDLSEINIPDNLFWNDEIKNIIISEFLSQLIQKAESEYQNERLLNTLVVLDEAHRLAPKDVRDDDSLFEVKKNLIDAIRTTRKYGLGWMFVSQTLSSLDKEIINQIRIFVFGFGLAWGVEQQSLRDIIGGNKEAIGLYRMFKDPQSCIGEKEYSFMTIGPISPLSFSGSPLFFSALKYPDEFLNVNYNKSNDD